MTNDNHNHEMQSTRFASALFAWKDFCDVKEHHGEDCVKHVKDAITLEIVSNLNPSAYSCMEEMKPDFLHTYQEKLKELGL